MEAEKDTQEKQLKITLTPEEAVGQRRKAGQVVDQKQPAGGHWHISFEEYKRGLEPYPLDFVRKLAKGDPDESLESFKKKLVHLADTLSTRSVTSCPSGAWV
ncbi:MAG: hypothetical protein V8R49_02520 [Duodenibacillus massiliensis]